MDFSHFFSFFGYENNSAIKGTVYKSEHFSDTDLVCSFAFNFRKETFPANEKLERVR